MNLLGNVLYDPAVAATKGAAASVLAVFDTTNARITFVVPPSGMVRVVIQCTVHGATTFSQIILGCLEGATVRGRVVPVGSQNGTALATTMMSQVADYVVSGLTPGASLTWDAAWGVETFVASSLIKYGGPNNTTANDNFGALIFQIWDTCPIYTPTSATAPTTAVSARVDSVKTKTDFLPSATAGAAGGLFIAGTNAATTITTGLTTTFTGSLTGSVASVTGAVGSVTAGVTLAASAVQAIWDALTSALTTVGSIGKLITTNLDALISSRMATYTQPTGFLAATFPAGTVASTTNITAGTITTATNLTNLPSIPANWITATGITAAALNGKGDWNIGKTGYSLTQTFPTNFASLAITAGGAVTAGTVSDKSGYSLTTAPLDAAGTRTALGMASANLDTQLGTLMTTAAYTAPDNTSITAIKNKTDSLTFTVAGKLDVNVLVVNGVAVTGAGSGASPWGPA